MKAPTPIKNIKLKRSPEVVDEALLGKAVPGGDWVLVVGSVVAA